jgi:D-glycero-D-manno-heptose 1,7-bisphosphate phosphatase
VQRLREAGFVIVAITNQPDVARGFLTAEAIDQQNALLQGTLSLDAVYVCPHDNAERCVCRKPRPGLLLEAAEDLDLNLTESWMIGDRWVDVAAADSAGVTPVLLQRPWSWDETSAGVAPDEFRRVASAESLASCVDIILAKPGVEIAT